MTVRSTLAVAVVLSGLIVVSACGKIGPGGTVAPVASWTRTSSPSPSDAASASPARLASPSPTTLAACPAASPSGDPAAGWIPLSNATGQFSLRYPCDWGVSNCDGYAALGPELKAGATTFCGTDERIPTILLVTFPSTTPAGQQPGEYVGDITGTTPVTADSVEGTRQTASVTADLPLPPAKGSTQVVYRFTTHGRTYVVFYTRAPGQPDLTGEVDTMVEQTLRFSA